MLEMHVKVYKGDLMQRKLQSIVIVILLIIISVMFVILVSPKKSTDTGKGIIFEQSISENSNSQVGTSNPGISIPGWGAIKLPAHEKEAIVSLHNPEENAGYYDLSFTLKLKNSNEVIFTTGSISAGYKCSRVTLTQELEPGEYEAIMFVQPYLVGEQHTPTNNAELELLLIVE